MKGEQLFFGMSVALTLEEAVAFKHSLGGDDRYHILKVRERPGDTHGNRRESWVVVRHVHKGERVERGYAVYGDRGMLI